MNSNAAVNQALGVNVYKIGALKTTGNWFCFSYLIMKIAVYKRNWLSLNSNFSISEVRGEERRIFWEKGF